MKHNLSLSDGRRRCEGVALIIVLAFLVLLTTLVVGFFSRARVERAVASAYFENNQTSLLADQAVGIVQAQIDHASTQKNKAWASQPGMVRTFAQDGTLEFAYKLYSDDSMVSDSVDLDAATAAMEGWGDSPAHYVDLNEPVNVGGERHFPILDERASGEIEGFEVKSIAGITEVAQRVPMPVKWLYILADGQAVAPTGGDGSKATIAGASVANPIVGRIAFWTDDETAKLNINTAAHGYFWDIPRASSEEERDRMARFQPAQREYQRYPGHPATTSLWPVFGSKFTTESEFAGWVYDTVPRIAKGGSEGGTVTAAAPVALDNERLYASVDELLFSAHDGVRDDAEKITREDIEKRKFFLTARSNSPEINLFHLPRMAIWPINSAPKTSSTLDQLLAFCATINDVPYYFQRSNPDSSSKDMTLPNEHLYSYISSLLDKSFPGFGSGKFTDTAKYGTDTAQIVTQVFDYIRSSNLHSTALGATAYTDGAPADVGSKSGQVVPLKINVGGTQTKGFGRIPAISKAVFQLYVSGIRTDDPNEFSDRVLTPVQTPTMANFRSSNARSRLADLLKVGPDDGAEKKDFYLITRGIIYFDLFDPMYGYAIPRYNFDIDVEFSGSWSVAGTDGVPRSLGFADSTVHIDHDHSLAYSANGNRLRNVWYGRFLGGNLGPLLGMQNYTYLKGNPPNNVTAGGSLNRPYPLVSVPVEIHTKMTLVKDQDGANFVLPAANTITDKITFSGGELKATIKVGSEDVQEYTFDFPQYTKPAPVFMDGTIQSGAFDTLGQFALNVDFRHRWQHQPIGNYIYPNRTSSDLPDIRVIQENDVAVALEPRYGDKRLIAAKATVASTDFQPHQWYSDSNKRIAADIRAEAFGRDRELSANRLGMNRGRIVPLNYGQNAWPDIPSRYDKGLQDSAAGVISFPPDFDNGTFHAPDDAYVNRADEGGTLDDTASNKRSFSWYTDLVTLAEFNNPTFFSPNKQMPSAGVFGSLPTGALRGRPWQTLLFRPDPGGHPGAVHLPDHLLLDLFWMPVVEPYAISERFSTNGKVNMNYQIQPFGGYLKRSTGVRGVLYSMNMLAIPNTAVGTGDDQNSTTSYKSFSDQSNPTFSNLKYRKRLNLSEETGTLRTFEDRFAANEVFISETEICTVPLIPEGEVWSADFESIYWSTHQLTGDNSREMPYTQVLPRLTTKSNTYTVHYRVQALKKVPTTTHDVWDEERDQITAELRGSRAIERYIDPNSAAIPNYAAASLGGDDPTNLKTLAEFYRWRVLNHREFSP